MERDFDQVHEALLARTVLPESKSAGNKDTFLAVVSAIAANNFEALPVHVSADAELQIHGFPEFEGYWKGRTDVVEAMARNFTKVTDQKTAIESVVEDGDALVLLIDETGRMKSTGEAYHVRAVIWCTFDEGRLRRIEEFSHPGGRTYIIGTV